MDNEDYTCHGVYEKAVDFSYNSRYYETVQQWERSIRMIQFDEEIKKFYKSPEVGEVEDVIYNQDMTDATDLLFKIMQQDDGRTTNRR